MSPHPQTRAGRLARFIPALGWLPEATAPQVRTDLVAGLTVGAMLVPQAMAYALLAGLPPYVGLYAATVPLFIYALLGTSRQLGVGPVAMDSLLVAAALAGVGASGDLGTAALLMLMVGAIQVALGLVRAGFLVNFLSRPVIGGFTSAAAIIIAVAQLRHLIGVPLTDDPHPLPVLLDAAARLTEIHGPTLALAAGSVAALLALHRWAPRLPAALLLIVASTLATWLLDLSASGLRTVGQVPSGLPPVSLPPFDAALAVDLLPMAATIALVAFMEAIAVGRAFATRHRYEIDPDQELRALGVANAAGSLFGGFPIAGGFSRSAVNDRAGARTPLAGLFAGLLVVFTLLFLTPLFRHLPIAALGALIAVAVSGLVDLRGARRLWRISRGDFFAMALTFLATLLLDIEQGILVGVGGAVLLYLVRTTQPHYAVLGRLPGTDVYRNRIHYPHAEQIPGLLILRFDAQFYFGNVTFLRDRLRQEEASACAGPEARPLRGVILDCSGVNALDATAADTLLELADEYRRRGVALRLASVKGPVRAVMARAGLYALIGEDRFFLSTACAVADHCAHAGCAQDATPPPPVGLEPADPAAQRVARPSIGLSCESRSPAKLR